MKRLIETRFFGIITESRTKKTHVKCLEEAFYEFADLCVGTSSIVCDYALFVRIINHTRTKLQTLQEKDPSPTEAKKKCATFYSIGYRFS